MLTKSTPEYASQGFTLIELSIVLVIIGLLVGGILVGRDLISAAEVRAQVSQIETYRTAVQTFRLKYSALPGDMLASDATQYGFVASDGSPGYGDGNGVIEGDTALGYHFFNGKAQLMWNHLARAGLIAGGFLADDGTGGGSTTTDLPPAKIGNGNFMFVWSGGYGVDLGLGQGGSGASSVDGNAAAFSNGVNYFGLALIAGPDQFFGNAPDTITPGITPSQAFAIDSKIDDGLPQSGRVTAMYPFPGSLFGNIFWSMANSINSAPSDGTTANPGSTTSCYDNSSSAANIGTGVAGAVNHYSTEIAGASITCALSFEFE